MPDYQLSEMSKKSNKRGGRFLVVDLLNSLSKSELADLGSFVACDYHNTDVQIVHLLEGLRQEVIHQKAFDDEAQCVVYSAIFPKKTAPKQSLNAQQKGSLLAKMTLLLRLVETFLMQEELKENTACQTELLHPQLLRRKQFALFQRNITKDNKILDTKTAKGVADYAQQFKIQSAILDYFRKKELLTKEDNLPKLIESLDVYYLVNKLELYVTCISLTDFSAQKSYDYAPMNAISTLLDIPQYANHPLIHTYQVAANLLKDNTIELYEKLIELLDTNSTFIANHDLDNFYKIAISFCTSKIKEGDSTYYRQIFDLFQIMDNKNLLKEGNFMSAGKLKNIITVSCKVGEFDWAKEAIEKYRPNLEKAHAKSVYHFNMGAVAFYQNDFKTALSHFIRVEKVNLAYDINCRIMLLKSHYELDHEYDERTIRTFLLSERFIQSHKGLITRDKKAYKNFVRILINIYNTRHGAGKMTAEKVKKKLKKLEFVSDKKWLEEKVERL